MIDRALAATALKNNKQVAEAIDSSAAVVSANTNMSPAIADLVFSVDLLDCPRSDADLEAWYYQIS